MNNCPSCKRPIKARNYSKLEAAKELARMMGWGEDATFYIRNNSLRTHQIQKIVEKLKEKK